MCFLRSTPTEYKAIVSPTQRQAPVLTPEGPALLELDGKVDSFVSNHSDLLPVKNFDDLGQFLKDPQVARLAEGVRAGWGPLEEPWYNDQATGRPRMTLQVTHQGWSGVGIQVGHQNISIDGTHLGAYAGIASQVPFSAKDGTEGTMEQVLWGQWDGSRHRCNREDYKITSWK